MALIIYAFTVVMSNAIIVWQKKNALDNNGLEKKGANVS